MPDISPTVFKRVLTWAIGVAGTGLAGLLFWGFGQVHDANAWDSEVDKKISDLRIRTGAPLFDVVAQNAEELLSIREILLLDRLDDKRSAFWDLEDARENADDWTERDEHRLRELEAEIEKIERELASISSEGAG